MPSNNVAYLGPKASYTHQAALQLFPLDTTSADLEPFPTISSVFTAVQSGQVSQGVVPFENSSNGAVLPTLDLFANLDTDNPDVHITGETFVDVHHYLLGHLPSDTSEPDLSQLKTIYSHPQAWGQCRTLLDSQLSAAARLDTTSTSAAAAHVASLNDPSVAAISSRLAADVYGLDILAASIEDKADNQTRFLLLSRRSQHPTTTGHGIPIINDRQSTKTKTLLHFRVPSHGHPGALAEALTVFGRHGLSLSSMYTRPDPAPAAEAATSSPGDEHLQKQQRWRYIFFVEFTSSAEQEARRQPVDSSVVDDTTGSSEACTVDVALAELRRCTKDLRLCGRWGSD